MFLICSLKTIILKNKILILFLAISITSQFAYSQEYGGIDKQWMKDLISNESKSFSKTQSVNSSHTSNYDIKFHRLEFHIDPAVYHISGVITTYFVPSSEMSNIKFDFTDAISVNEVRYNGGSLEFSQSDDDILTCNFKSTLSIGKLDSIQVIYSGAPELGAYGISQSFHNSVPIISTLSEPYGAKDWWPCKQDLIDKADSIEVIITTPKEYSGVSNGLKVDEVIDGVDRISTWKHNYPIPAYLIAFAVTNYEDFTIEYENIEGETLPILNHVYPEDLESAKISIETTKLALDLFENLFEIYPYSKERYGHAQFQWNGGMEHATVSFMGSFPEDLIAHELAHQWFGDKITCGSWSDIWLNEGFATYLTGLTYEHYKGGFDGWLQGKIDHVTSSTGGSVYVTDTTTVGSIFSSRLSYSKGAMVLHMLRWKMGDDDFYQAIKNYLKDENLKYSYAKTEDLIRHCETVSGDDLSIFFDQWIYKEGYPSYAVQWKQNEDKSVMLLIDQSQSHSSVDFFEMPVQLSINGVEGEQLLVKFDVNSGNFRRTLDVDFEVLSVDFDPNKWLITKDNTVLLNPDLAISKLDEELWTSMFNDNSILINTSNTSVKSIAVNLYDTSGKLIVSKKLIGEKVFTLQTEGLSSGVYYLVIDSGSRIFSNTLLK